MINIDLKKLSSSDGTWANWRKPQGEAAKALFLSQGTLSQQIGPICHIMLDILLSPANLPKVLNFFMRFQRSKESTLTQNSSTADIAILDDALKDEQIHSNIWLMRNLCYEIALSWRKIVIA